MILYFIKFLPLYFNTSLVYLITNIALGCDLSDSKLTNLFNIGELGAKIIYNYYGQIWLCDCLAKIHFVEKYFKQFYFMLHPPTYKI